VLCRVAAQGFQQGVDYFASVLSREVILFNRTKIRDAGRLRSAPPLAAIDSPQMHHNCCRFRRAQSVWHLDDATRVIRKPPCPHLNRRLHRRRSLVPHIDPIRALEPSIQEVASDEREVSVMDSLHWIAQKSTEQMDYIPARWVARYTRRIAKI